MSDSYTPPPTKTMDDIDEVRDFIKARVTPLLAKAEPNSDEERACQALLDMMTLVKGSARWQIENGDNPSMLHFYLCTAAQQWRDHPDFLPEWLG